MKQNIELQKGLFKVLALVEDQCRISRLALKDNTGNQLFEINEKTPHFAGSSMHNPSRMAKNLHNYFTAKLSINKDDEVYENDYNLFAAIVIHDTKITLFSQSNYKENKELYGYLTNPEFHKVKDMVFICIEKEQIRNFQDK